MSNEQPAVSVVVPCYNEAKNLAEILRRFAEAGKNLDFELVLVDNGSRDETASVLNELLPGHPFARSILVKVNQGYGHGVWTGLQAARGRVLCWTHADLQTDPQDVFAGLELFRKMGDHPPRLVKGRRIGRPASQRVISWGMQTLATILFRRRMHEINAQPKIFSRALLPHIAHPPVDFNFDVYVLHQALQAGWRIESFPVRFPPRVHGQSNWASTWRSKLRTIAGAVRYMIQLAWRGEGRTAGALFNDPHFKSVSCPAISRPPTVRKAA